MANYTVAYKLHKDKAEYELSDKEFEVMEPTLRRVSASNATRAISSIVNDLKRDHTIGTKNDVVIVEAKVVA